MTDLVKTLRVITPHTTDWQLEVLKHHMEKGPTKQQRVAAVEVMMHMLRASLRRDGMECPGLNDAIEQVGNAYDDLLHTADRRQAAINRKYNQEGVEADSDRLKDEELGN